MKVSWERVAVLLLCFLSKLIRRQIQKNIKWFWMQISRDFAFLLAEDNELNMEIARFILEDCGALVEPVSNGLEAVHKFEASDEETFDVILMDVMMPVMDGITATKTIRAMERPDAKTIPIIAMTANAFKEDEEKCMAAGMNEHLAKPLEEDKVVRAIYENIVKKRA